MSKNYKQRPNDPRGAAPAEKPGIIDPNEPVDLSGHDGDDVDGADDPEFREVDEPELPEPMPILKERYRHTKRGSSYETVGYMTVQAAAPINEGDLVVGYRSEDGVGMFVRPASEFLDGRFTELPALQKPATGEAGTGGERPSNGEGATTMAAPSRSLGDVLAAAADISNKALTSPPKTAEELVRFHDFVVERLQRS